MKSSELLTIFDIQRGTDDVDSMSREKFREIMSSAGLVISKDQALLDSLFDIFDIFFRESLITIFDHSPHLDESGTVERKELLVGLITLHSGALTQKLKCK